MAARLNPQSAIAIVLAWPGGLVRPELVHWFSDNGFPRSSVRYLAHQARDASQVANYAISVALRSGKEWALFSDNDVRPTENTSIESVYDITCARCDTGNPNSYSNANDFHSAFWFARVETLLKIPAPWFRYPEYKPGAFRVSQCYCSAFSEAAKVARLSIGWHGHAIHKPSPLASGEDFICRTPKHQC